MLVNFYNLDWGVAPGLKFRLGVIKGLRKYPKNNLVTYET